MELIDAKKDLSDLIIKIRENLDTDNETKYSIINGLLDELSDIQYAIDIEHDNKAEAF